MTTYFFLITCHAKWIISSKYHPIASNIKYVVWYGVCVFVLSHGIRVQIASLWDTCYTTYALSRCAKCFVIILKMIQLLEAMNLAKKKKVFYSPLKFIWNSFIPRIIRRDIIYVLGSSRQVPDIFSVFNQSRSLSADFSKFCKMELH